MKLYWGYGNIMGTTRGALRWKGSVVLNKKFKRLYFISRVDEIISIDSDARKWDEFKMKPMHFVRRK